MQVKRIYEGMFLAETGFASNWERVEETISRLMERAGAELLYCKKWDERRLAYEIDGKKRGMYVLTFFKASPDAPTTLERDVQLTHGLLRVLVLKQNRLTEEKITELAAGEGLLPVHAGPDGPPWGPRRRDDRSGKDRFNRDRDRDRPTAPKEAAAVVASKRSVEPDEPNDDDQAEALSPATD